MCTTSSTSPGSGSGRHGGGDAGAGGRGPHGERAGIGRFASIGRLAPTGSGAGRARRRRLLSDLIAAARQIDGGPASGLELLASVGLTRAYPEMLSLLNDPGREMVEQIGDMCVGDATSAFPYRRLNEFTHAEDPLSEPVAVEVMEKNHLGRQAPGAPVFLYHSVFDELIPFATARQLRADWCDRGVAVAFHSDLLSEHSSLAVTGAPLAVGYLGSRFAGVPAPNTCQAGV